jgi:hypothetical protein
MKNSNDIIGNRTRDLPACSAVPQPTALPRAPPTKGESKFTWYMSMLIHVRLLPMYVLEVKNLVWILCFSGSSLY